MKLFLRAIVLVGLTAILTACPQTKEEKGLSDTLLQYETIVRWAQWDAATDFIAPEYVMDHPISRLDLDRLRLFKVTQYLVRSSAPVDEGNTFLQTVEIRMFNKNQARERSVIDNQIWKWNETTGRWQLHSSLPDPTKKNY